MVETRLCDVEGCKRTGDVFKDLCYSHKEFFDALSTADGNLQLAASSLRWRERGVWISSFLIIFVVIGIFIFFWRDV